MTPRAAVILVDTNDGRFLERTLSLLREQTVAPARTIVADNASTDGSPAMVEERFPEVEVLRLGRNAGFAAANNAAVAHADDCEWIALLNPDAYPETRWLEALLDAADRHPEFGFFASRMVLAADDEEL